MHCFQISFLDFYICFDLIYHHHYPQKDNAANYLFHDV